MAKNALGQDFLVGQTLGHYRLVERIDEGGQGTVYRAHDQHLDNREVAIKILPQGSLADQTSRKRFRKEADALSKLNHPNIASVIDFDSSNGIDYLVEEFVEGVSLNEMLANGPLTGREVIHFGSQLCEGLAAAHERGIIHRDIKPGNICITPEARLKIIDFGMAKTLPAPVPIGTEPETLSQSQTVVGTWPYISPEQLRNEKLDGRTDIWSAGCVLYEMATGRRPFLGQGLALIDEILHQEPAQPSKLNHKMPPALEAIILKCLEKDPSLRYASARDIEVDLRRLQAGVTSGFHPSPAPPHPRLWKLVGLGLGILAVIITLISIPGIRRLGDWLTSKVRTPHIQSLAVLPVKNFSGDPAQEFFADGMTDALIAGLADIKAVKVISRTSVMHFKGTNETLPKIARALGVDGIVEASVMRAGSRVRITAQLIDARKDQLLWSQNYERETTDVLRLQSEVVQAIAGEIRVQVTPQESARLKTTRRVDPEVYDATLQGTAILEYATREDQLRKSIELFQKAIDQDPSYAPAWAGLGEALWYLAATGFEFVAPGEVRDRAIAAADKALELDPSLPEAHKARATIAIDAEWDLAKAQQHFERALELRPSYAAAHNLYGQILVVPLSRFSEADRHFTRARELDPLSPWDDINPIISLIYQGRPEKALDEGKVARQRNPTDWIIPYHMGKANLLLGNGSQAAANFEAALNLLQPDRPAAILSPLGLAYGLVGRKRDALKILAELKQASQAHYVSPSDLAVVYSGLGDMDRAFQLLEQAFQQRTPSLVYCTPSSPNWVTIQRDPRWKAFSRRLQKSVQLPADTPDLYSQPAGMAQRRRSE